MHKIKVLWATMRSTSTAFEWMMRQRGDLTCFHEPFGEAWYYGEEPLWPRATPETPRNTGLTLDSVFGTLKGAAAKGPVFSKDFAHYIYHMADDAFLDHFQHSFLIRDPAKVITSVYMNWPDFHMIELGMIEQRNLFDRLSDEAGQAMPLIDSDDLLEDPHGIVEAYCISMDLPFMPEALSWTPGDRGAVSWYDKGSWHEKLRNSDGLKPQPRKAIDISEAPDRVKEIYDIVMPHYSYLHSHRLKAAA